MDAPDGDACDVQDPDPIEQKRGAGVGLLQKARICLVLILAATAPRLAAAVRPGTGATTAATQITAETTFSTADLLEDARVLRRTYETLHPGLYRYNTRPEMDAHFEALEQSLQGPRTLREAYGAFSRFLGAIRCGHSYTNFFNQPKSVAAALFQGETCVPFYFVWLDGGRMVVIHDFSGGRLGRGDEVLSINGTPTREILAALLPLSRADGGNDAKRVAGLEVRGEAKIEAFDVFFPIVYSIPAGQPLRLEVRAPGEAASRRVDVAPVTAAGRAERATLQPAAGAPGPATTAPASADVGEHGWRLTRPDARTAVIRMPTWALYNSKWDWRAYLNDRFDALIAEGIEDVILDLRGNEGGLDCGDAIVARIADRPVKDHPAPRMVRYRKVPDDLRPYLDTWDDSFFDWGEDAQPSELEGLFTLQGPDDPRAAGQDQNLIRPSGRRFTGRVWVIIDSSNSSATFQFAERVRRERLGTLVGQTTGGNQRGINGGAFFFLRLPKTRIEVDVPLIARFPGNEKPDGGIEPDVRVARTSGDVASGIDRELATIMSLISEARKPG